MIMVVVVAVLLVVIAIFPTYIIQSGANKWTRLSHIYYNARQEGTYEVRTQRK